MAALVVGPVQVPVAAEPAPLVDRVTIGAYVHLQGQPFRDPVAPEHLAEIESKIGRLDLVHYFFTWGRPFGEAVTSNLDGRQLMLSMKPDGDLVGRIASGEQNAYLDRFARDARAHGKPVYLRFGHEMNGDWMSYSAGRPGGPSAAQFVRAWRHLVERFRAAGATNVKFVWSPNEKDFPARDGNRMEDYWPGDAYVDVAGFDGYNWSTAEPRRGDGQDRTFEQVVEGPYDRISRLTTRTIWLCEFGTTDPGKGRWFRDMFASTRFPRLTGIVYFSEHDERDVQRDWRIDSSADAVAGWRDAVAARAPRPAPTTPAPTTPAPTPTSTASPKPAVDQQVHLPTVSRSSPFSPQIVRSVQSLLTARGFAVPVTGTFDERTEKATKGFQQRVGLAGTGVVGAATWSRLLYG